LTATSCCLEHKEKSRAKSFYRIKDILQIILRTAFVSQEDKINDYGINCTSNYSNLSSKYTWNREILRLSQSNSKPSLSACVLSRAILSPTSWDTWLLSVLHSIKHCVVWLREVSYIVNPDFFFLSCT